MTIAEHLEAALGLCEYAQRFRPEVRAAMTREQVAKALHAVLMIYETEAGSPQHSYAQAGLMNALGIDYWKTDFAPLKNKA